MMQARPAESAASVTAHGEGRLLDESVVGWKLP